MNDKIKDLLAKAYQTDSIAKNKWRIENREQLRKERKEKLKELMEKDKQQTAVDAEEAALDDYNRMEEEWEMENYNEMNNLENAE